MIDAISRCVDEMSLGMIDFTRKQADTRSGQVLIATVEDLDRYCYYVAGTVGNLLCELFTLHSPLIGKAARQGSYGRFPYPSAWGCS